MTSKRFVITIAILTVLVRTVCLNKTMVSSTSKNLGRLKNNESENSYNSTAMRVSNRSSSSPEDYIYILSDRSMNPNRPFNIEKINLRKPSYSSFRNKSNKGQIIPLYADPEASPSVLGRRMRSSQYDYNYEPVIDSRYPMYNYPTDMGEINSKQSNFDINEYLRILSEFKRSPTLFDRWSLKKAQKLDNLQNKIRSIVLYYQFIRMVDDIKKRKKSVLNKLIERIERKILGKTKL